MNKRCRLAIVICTICALSLCSCVPTDYQEDGTERILSNDANFPQTLTLRGLVVDYPEGFDASKETDTTLVTGDMIYSGKRQTIANSDYSIFFTVEVYEGITFNDIERNVFSQIHRVQEGSLEPSEAVPELNIPEGYNQLFTMKDPEYLTINGNRVLSTVIGRTDIEEAYVYDYFLSISDSAVGKVRVGYTNEQYEANSAIYDGVIASMRVDE